MTRTASSLSSDNNLTNDNTTIDTCLVRVRSDERLKVGVLLGVHDTAIVNAGYLRF